MDFKTKFFAVTSKPVSGLLKIIVLAFVLFPALTFCQGTSDVDPSPESMKHIKAPVQVDGVVLFYVRGASAYPPEVRAATIRKRIYKAARNFSLPVDSVRSYVDANRIRVYAGKNFIMNIYDEDGDSEGLSKELLADIIKVTIKTAINRYWESRSPASIKANVVRAAVALIIILVLIALIIWIIKRINESLRTRVRHRIETLENVSFKLIQSNRLLKLFQAFYRIIRVFIICILAIVFVNYVLSLFPWTKGISNYIFDLILTPIRQLGKDFIGYLPSLIFLIIIFIITNYILKLIKLFFTGLNTGGIVIQSFYPEWSMPTYKIVRFLVIVFAVVVAYPYIPGSGSSAFQGISVFLGILFSLGSSSFIANVIAGYSMTFRRAFQNGDRVKINDFIGFVENQSLMVTRIRSVKNEEIIIPNSVLLNSTVLNFSHLADQRGAILHTTVKIGYGTSWRKVDAMLILAADRTEGLLKDPAPFVLKRELGDFAITYEINAYCHDVSRLLHVYSVLHQNILDLFNENNVQIMVPAYEGDPETPKVVSKEEWNAPLANETDVATQAPKS